MLRRCAFVLIVVIVFGLTAASRRQSANALQRRGVAAFKAGQFAAAQRIFSALVQQDPSGVTYSHLAAAEGALGDYSAAIAHFRKSIQLGNDTPAIRYNLALAYLKDHQLHAGIQELRAAVARDPQSTAARYALGVALLDAGQPREALTYFDQVQAPLQKNPGLWTNRVRAEFGVGNVKKALQTTNQASRALPQDTRLAAALANLCLSHAQPQKARELLENASEEAPDNENLKLLLAQASLKAEEPMEALAVLKNVPARAGAPGEVTFLRGSALMLGGKLKEAGPLLASAVAADPRNVNYISTDAELQASRRNYKGALASLRKAQQLRPNSPDFPYQTALIYIFMRRYPDAATACQKATRLAPNFDQAYFVLGAIQLDQADPEAAEKAFRRAETIKPTSALYHSALGAALFKMGRLAEGKKELDHALLLDPQTLSAYFWRAEISARQKEPTKAIADLETFVAFDPDYPEAYSQLARLYAAQGQAAKALPAQAKYQAVKKKIGTTTVPFFLSQLGITRFRQARSRPQ